VPLDYTASNPQGFGYTVFGKVIEGMDVVNKIAKVEKGAKGMMPRDVPKTPILIRKASVIETDSKAKAQADKK
jgi:cyclophilin family peptidyl-prolyl cis-trans isomerase